MPLFINKPKGSTNGTENTGGTPGTSVDIVPYDTGNYSVTYEYNGDFIVKETITGDIDRVTSFAYFPVGSTDEGKIQKETIEENGKSVARTYTYNQTTGQISSVSTVTTTL